MKVKECFKVSFHRCTKTPVGKDLEKSQGERSTRSNCHQKYGYEVMPQTSLKTSRASFNCIKEWVTSFRLLK